LVIDSSNSTKRINNNEIIEGIIINLITDSILGKLCNIKIYSLQSSLMLKLFIS